MKRSLVICMTALVASISAAAASAPAGYEQQTVERPRRVQIPVGSFLGVELGEVNRETAARLKLSHERGALIEGVTTGSSAAQAGLQTNDVVVKWDGQPIESAREMSRRIRETPAGRTVRLGVVRDGREIEVNVKLGERRTVVNGQGIFRSAPAASTAVREEAARARAQAMEATREATVRAREQTREAAARAREQTREATTRAREQAREATTRAREQARDALARTRVQMRVPVRLGVELQSMTPQLAEYFGLSKRTGALVVFVFADSPAAKAGLKTGDVILSAGGENVENPMDLRRVLMNKSEGAIEVKILRDKQERALTVQLEKGTGSWLLKPEDQDEVIRAEIEPMVINIPQVAIAPMAINIPKVHVATGAMTIPRINITPAVITIPKIVVPKIDLSPMTIQMPKIEMAPMAIPDVKIDLAPMKVQVPKINISPINIVVAPRRVWL